MQGDEFLGQVHLFGGIQRGQVALVDGAAYRFVNLGVAVAEDVGAHPHEAQIQVFGAVQIPDPAALGAIEVRRPAFGQIHLGPLREQHGATRDTSLGLLPQLGSFAHIAKARPQGVAVRFAPARA